VGARQTKEPEQDSKKKTKKKTKQKQQRSPVYEPWFLQ